MNRVDGCSSLSAMVRNEVLHPAERFCQVFPGDGIGTAAMILTTLPKHTPRYYGHMLFLEELFGKLKV
jgi:hypothetical protein